ncbi:uncharacterized protein G2W53_027345 [Senna tora]|uniref:Uncharacterized protein n=1 Tax=Senna tora TaxID=362788 RepID=A0A834TJ64_9FABA|nr:uncharacterized protein G2W53_027345 [Senna tora]
MRRHFLSSQSPLPSTDHRFFSSLLVSRFRSTSPLTSRSYLPPFGSSLSSPSSIDISQSPFFRRFVVAAFFLCCSASPSLHLAVVSRYLQLFIVGHRHFVVVAFFIRRSASLSSYLVAVSRHLEVPYRCCLLSYITVAVFSLKARHSHFVLIIAFFLCWFTSPPSCCRLSPSQVYSGQYIK